MEKIEKMEKFGINEKLQKMQKKTSKIAKNNNNILFVDKFQILKNFSPEMSPLATFGSFSNFESL